MKNTQTLTYTCAVLIFINLFNILFYSCRHSRSAVQSPYAEIISSGVTEGYGVAVVTDVVLPTVLDLGGEKVPLHRQDVQESLKRELIVNSYLHSHTLQILQIAPRVFSIIEPILKAQGVPDDFKYLAVIESRLDPLSVSPAGATGVWQFMKNTAKEFNLEVTDEVDERYHLEKSTAAAAVYLKKAYEKFNSWTLAAAAYNAGSAMVNRQMDIQKEMNYYDLLLGEETGRYVFRILALKQIMNHPQLYHFNPGNPYPTEKTYTKKVEETIPDLAVFAQKEGINYKILKRFNPWLRKNELNNGKKKTYEIIIPEEKEKFK